MIIEIEIGDQFYYVKAQIPPDNFEERLAEYLKNRSKWPSVKDLLDKLKTRNVSPHQRRMQVLQAITKEDVYVTHHTNFDANNTFKITPNALNQLEEFDWEEIMNFAQEVIDVWQALICV